jgi:hypothetical protein
MWPATEIEYLHLHDLSSFRIGWTASGPVVSSGTVAIAVEKGNLDFSLSLSFQGSKRVPWGENGSLAA